MGSVGDASSDRDTVDVPGYVVDERLGAGGFGEVFAARHPLIGRDVAIKVLHAKYSANREAVARFIAEARAVNKVSHPGIVEIHDFGQLADGRHYCVMERLRGETLRDILRERTRLPLADALPILRGIADAVDAAHAAGIAHRDLKPDNVFVLADGSIKLIDFGLAKLSGEDTAITETGSVFGTPLYMSPEQCRGDATDARADLYSFGALAYHVLAGAAPFDGDPLALALHHVNDEPVAPSKHCGDLDGRVDRVLLALLAKDPAQRPRPLASAIASITGDAPLPPKRRRWRWAIAPILALAAASTGLIAWRARSAVEVDECALGDVDGVWSDAAKAQLAARFAAANRVDVTATWKRVSTDIDAVVAQWKQKRSDACASSDRTKDPLLYAQRITCLAGIRDGLAALHRSLMAVDVVEFSNGITIDFTLTNVADPTSCDDVERLRETRPPPPVEHAAEIEQLGNEWRLARAEFRQVVNAGGDFAKVQPALDRMEAVAQKRQQLGASNTNETIWWASYHVNLAGGDKTWIPKARIAVATAIERAEAQNDDANLVGALRERLRLETLAGTSALELEPTFEQAAAAARRAGTPNPLVLIETRAALARRDGDHEKAIMLLEEAIARQPRMQTLYNREALSESLHAVGRDDEAIARMKENVELHLESYGKVHTSVGRSLVQLARRQLEAKRHADAATSSQQALAIYAEIGHVSPTLITEAEQIHTAALAGED